MECTWKRQRLADRLHGDKSRMGKKGRPSPANLVKYKAPTMLPMIVLLWINAGKISRSLGVHPRHFDAERALLQACKATGLQDFGEPGFMEPLQILLKGLSDEAKLTAFGRSFAWGMLQRLLQGRLHLVDVMDRHPEIDEQTLEEPLFVVGLPRTGTTLLHHLLAQDTSSRSPATWEVHYIYPPPDAATYTTDPRIARMEKTLAKLDALLPTFKRIHHVTAQSPQECMGFMMYDFASFAFPGVHFDLPTYWTWYEAADLYPTYKFMRWQLKYLQWRGPKGQRWVLKCPAHLWSMKYLIKAFPDARFIFTHRDPLKTLASAASLITTSQRLASQRVNISKNAAEWAPRFANALASCEAARYAHGLWDPRRAADLHFDELIRSPVESMQTIYSGFGYKMTEALQGRMKTFLRNHERDKHGAHQYSWADTALDEGRERNRFSSYEQRFDIPRELL